MTRGHEFDRFDLAGLTTDYISYVVNYLLAIDQTINLGDKIVLSIEDQLDILEGLGRIGVIAYYEPDGCLLLTRVLTTTPPASPLAVASPSSLPSSLNRERRF